jgi:hypothetical protein
MKLETPLYCRVERRVAFVCHPDGHSLFAGYFQEMRRAFCIPNRNKISDFCAFLKIISILKIPVFSVP